MANKDTNYRIGQQKSQDTNKNSLGIEVYIEVLHNIIFLTLKVQKLKRFRIFVHNGITLAK